MNFDLFNTLKKLLSLPLAGWLRLVGLIFIRKTTSRAVVVFYNGKLGDMVCLTPVLAALKSNYPNQKLIVYARNNFLDVWQNNPNLDEIIGFAGEQESGRFSWLIKQWQRLNSFQITAYYNLMNNFEGGILGLMLAADCHYTVSTELDGRLLRLLYHFYSTNEYKFDCLIKDFYFEWLKKNGLKIEGNLRNQLFFPGDQDEVEDFFSANSLAGQTVISVIISSGKDYKIWPLSYWLELLKRLQNEYQPVFLLFGLKEDENYLEQIKTEIGVNVYLILGKDLEIIPYYLKKSHLFIGVDTGLLYMADALSIPVVDILGPCDDNNQRPENTYRLVTDRAVCRPQCKMLYNAPINKTEVAACFLAIRPEQVFGACRDLLLLVIR
ncbi:MAG: glycosyltransferase family 9 protein [Patescibacteria group bacterium]|jgi:ADP-heptose:LPS heptosyltransferase